MHHIYELLSLLLTCTKFSRILCTAIVSVAEYKIVYGANY